MTKRNSCSYFDYLNKLVEEYNNNYHHSIDKNPIHADYSALSEEIESNLKNPTKKKNIFSNGYTENWSKQIFVMYWKTIKKYLIGEKILRRF